MKFYNHKLVTEVQWFVTIWLMFRHIFILLILFCSQSLTSQSAEQVIENLTSDQLKELGSLVGGTEQIFIEENSSTDNDLSLVENMPDNPLSGQSKIFGFDYINTIPTSITSTSDLPVPNDYLISLNDKIRVILSGSQKGIFEVSVGLNGAILLPEIGSVQVLGDTYQELKDKLSNLIQVTYVGANIDISLSSLSAKKITIIGAVNTPGTYLVNPFTTISNSLAYSGGLKNYASLRNIQLIRTNGEKLSFDLYELLIDGNRQNDLNIQAGDTILVPSSTNFVSTNGALIRPMIYEFKDSETVQDIIDYAMGPDPSANTEKIALKVLSPESNVLVTKEISLLQETSLQNVKSIELFAEGIFTDLDIKVEGPLVNQGFFNPTTYKYLNELIADLKFTDQVYPFVAVVETGSISKLFSLSDISTQNIELSKNTKVKFFSSVDYQQWMISSLNSNSKDLINDYVLTINLKNQAYTFPVFGKFNVLDIVRFLGLDMSDVISNKTTYLSPVDNIVVVDEFESMSFISEKFHSLSFRTKSSDLIRVTVTGEVALPGIYSLPQETTLHDLYMYFGGIKKSADSNIAIFTRSSIRDLQIKALEKAQLELNEIMLGFMQTNNSSITPAMLNLQSLEIDESSLGRIAGDFSYDSEIAKSFLLQDGDSIEIPKKVMTVSIIGEVLNPSTIIHSNKYTLKDYVSNAGGYKQFALKREVYVIRADGTISKMPRNIFGKQVKIMPGDTIVVPRDIKVDDNLIALLSPVTSIISNVAFAAASLEALRSNN